MTDAFLLSKLVILIEKITSIENVKKYNHAKFFSRFLPNNEKNVI